MVYKKVLLIAAILAVGFLALWTIMLSINSKPEVFVKNENVPDGYMEEVTAMVMDKQGKLKMQVQTPRLTHYNEKNTSILISPSIIMYRNSTWPWYITAKTAKALLGVEQVNFYDDVHIQHPADKTSPATLIRTETLTVLPDQQVARTEDFITLSQPNLKVSAKGMYADMGKGTIQLIAETKGEYEPQ